MLVKNVVLGCLFFSSLSVALPVSRQINVYTEIEKSKFSLGEFVDVRFVPDSLLATFDKSLGTFRTLNTNLSLVTNLATTELNNGFSVLLAENSIVCTDASSQEIALTATSDIDMYGFAKLNIDGVNVPVGKSIQISKFNVTTNGFFEGYYPVSIDFSALSGAGISQGKCSGNISVRVEFNI